MNKEVTTKISLFVLLLFLIGTSVFPILGHAVIRASEDYLLQSGDWSAIWQDYSGEDLQISTKVYLIVSYALVNVFGGINPVVALRLPNAIIMSILTMLLFWYNHNFSRTGQSFFTALVFLCCGWTFTNAVHASPFVLDSMFLVLALIATYLWLKRKSYKMLLAMTVATLLATIMIGIFASITVWVVTCLFIFVSKRFSVIDFVKVTLSVVLSTVLAYVILSFFIGSELAINLVITQVLSLTPEKESNMLMTFFHHLFLASFPISIPLIIGLIGAIRRGALTKENFMQLTLHERFGIVLMLMSIPFMFQNNNLAVVTLLTIMLFNVPLVCKFLNWQFEAHPNEWRICGATCAIITSAGALGFIYLKLAGSFCVGGISLVAQGEWSVWGVILLILLAYNIYNLWRSKPYIKRNHRYMYNLILMYLYAISLYSGYIYPEITINY